MNVAGGRQFGEMWKRGDKEGEIRSNSAGRSKTTGDKCGGCQWGSNRCKRIGRCAFWSGSSGEESINAKPKPESTRDKGNRGEGGSEAARQAAWKIVSQPQSHIDRVPNEPVERARKEPSFGTKRRGSASSKCVFGPGGRGDITKNQKKQKKNKKKKTKAWAQGKRYNASAAET